MIAVAGVAGLLILRASDGPLINPNLMALLPKADRDPVIFDAISQAERRFQRHLVIIVGAFGLDDAKSAADIVAERLRQTGEFATLKVRHETDLLKQAFSFYHPFRFQLLTPDARRMLEEGKLQEFERSVLLSYYDPRSTTNSSLIRNDPFLLLPRFLEARAAAASGRPAIRDGYLSVQEGDRSYVALIGELSETPFSFALQQKLMPVLDTLRVELPAKFEGADLLLAGVLPHAAAGTDSALDETSTVGLASLLAIVVLLVGMFRSPLPLVVTVTTIALGCLGGFAACLAVFGEVQLLTLVFGASLVGISVDYALHFYCARFRFGADWSPDAALRHIFPGITLGLITSVIGFAGLFFAPFPGMRGMALFSSVGLAVAYSCVAICFPAFSANLKGPGFERGLDWLRRYGEMWQKPKDWRIASAAALVLMLASVGCVRLVASDDVRLLQTPDPEVMAEELRTRELFGRNLASQFFLVEGSDEADYLAREERLIEALRSLAAQERLEGYLAISDFVASPGRQLKDRALIEALVSGKDSLLDRFAERIGLPDETRDNYVSALAKARDNPPVQIAEWLNHPVSGPYHHLWLGQSMRGVAGVVGLRGVHDLAAMREIAIQDPRLHFIDPAGDVSRLFGLYRVQTIWLSLASYAVVAVLLILRYGVSQGLAVMAPPALAAFVSLGVLGYLGEPISLFNVMALLLVLGIGVDYALFFRETGRDSPATLLAITLSSLTTALAFGLLAFSATTAIHAFGLTVLIGIIVAFVLSPMAGWQFGNRAGRQS